MFGGKRAPGLMLLLMTAALGPAAVQGLLGGPPIQSGSGLLHSLAATGPAATAAGNTTAAGIPTSLVVVGSGLLMAIAFTAGYFIIPRGGIDELFLVHDSGLLLVHFSKTLRPTKDRDVLVGMLTAVQTFVKDAFSQGPATSLRQMDFGDRRILIAKGSYGYLAVIVRGRAPWGIARRMRRALYSVETKYRVAIASWDGSTDALAGADDVLIASLLNGFLRRFRDAVVATARRTWDWMAERSWRVPLMLPPFEPLQGFRTDLQETAHALLECPELQAFRPEHRDMLATALQEIEDGRFSLTGLANVYMVMALQKNPRPNVVGWWNLVLKAVREVLWSWPWTPASQAWVQSAPEDLPAVHVTTVAEPLDAPVDPLIEPLVEITVPEAPPPKARERRGSPRHRNGRVRRGLSSRH